MTGYCMARHLDDCQQTIADTGLAICPEPLCERDWTRSTVEEAIAEIRRVYPDGTHPDVDWLARWAAGVLRVVAAHEAAADGQPLGWAADIRSIEGEL